jgi:hypothetical protein
VLDALIAQGLNHAFHHSRPRRHRPAALAARLQHLLDNKTKPVGSLGQLEPWRSASA